MNKIFKWADEMTPVGIEGRKELGWAAFGLGFSLFYSLFYYASLWTYIDNLYTFSDAVKRKVLIPGAYMPDFAEFAPKYLVMFLITALAFLTLSGYHYLFHYQGAKSIYTMRRLPDRWELHRRCLAIPLAVALICLVSAVALTGIFLFSYYKSVPVTKLRPGQLQILIDTLFGGTK